jgi:erythromycin esterase
MLSALLACSLTPGILTPLQNKLAIRKAIGNSRVVALGELTHGDAESFRIKVDLCKWLHQEMGFDVLIWESGIYDCEEMNRELGGTKPLTEVAAMGVFGHWSRGVESFPIFEYSRESYKTKRPLQMAGFDLQSSGTASWQQFPEILANWFKDRPELSAKDREAIQATFKAVGEAKVPAEQQKATIAVWETSNRFLAAMDKDPSFYQGAEWRYRRQVLTSGREMAKMLTLYNGGQDFFTPYNLRERVNADNLVYLVNERYRGKKVIVWAHNIHLFRGVPNVGAGIAVTPGEKQLESMGRLVSKRLGKQWYAMGVVARTGTWAWLGNPEIRYVPSSVDSLENRLAKFGVSPGFVDLRSLPANHEFRAPWAATLNQQQPLTMKIRWHEAFDGLLYVDKMTPRTQMPAK